MAHKHTSYRVLFVLMLLPIGLMALVENIHAGALDLGVTATVPAPIPGGTPTIDSPTSGSTVTSSTVTVSGTCPVISPAILISIRKGSTSLGTTTCDGSGLYSVNITLGYGTHNIFARVVTITGGIGNDSTPSTTILRPAPPAPSPSPSPTPTSTPNPDPPTSTPQVSIPLPQIFPQVISQENFAAIAPPTSGGGGSGGGSSKGGEVAWEFSIKGGALPYIVSIDWGDGTVDKYDVPSHAKKVYTHVYAAPGTYIIKVRVVDANGRVSEYNTVAASQFERSSPALGLGLDNRSTPGNPFMSFLQQYALQIYVGAFSALIFLWYLEHGRHLPHLHWPRLIKH